MTLFRIIRASQPSPVTDSKNLPPSIDPPSTPQDKSDPTRLPTHEKTAISADQSISLEPNDVQAVQGSAHTPSSGFYAVLDEVLLSPEVYGDFLWEYVVTLGVETMLSYLDHPNKAPKYDSQRLRRFVQDISPYVIAHGVATKPEQKKKIRDEALQKHSSKRSAEFDLDHYDVTIAEINRSIIFQREIIHMIPEDDPMKFDLMRRIAEAYNLRYQKLRRLSDLEQSIMYLTRLLDQLPPSEELKRSWISHHLAQYIEIRFQQSGDVANLSIAIDHYRNARRLLPLGVPAVTQCCFKLISALEKRFQLLGDRKDREEAIEVHAEGLVISKDALDRASPDDPDYIQRLADRISILKIPIQQPGDLAGVVWPHSPKAIVQRLPSTTPLNARLQAISRVASSLLGQFEQTGELCYVDEALTFGEEMHEMARSNNHEALLQGLASLGVARKHRFTQSGDMADLDKAIEYHRELIQPELLEREGDAGKVCFLTCLSSVLCKRFVHLRDMSDMDEAFSHAMEALRLAPPDSPLYGGILSQFSQTISVLCERRSGVRELSSHFLTLLDECVRFMQETLDVFPRDNFFYYTVLHQLATVIRTRAQLLGSVDDTNKAVELFRALLETSNNPTTSPGTNLYNLANVLHDRYRLTKETSDLEEAISHFRQAETEAPVDGSFQGEIAAALGAAYYDRVVAKLDIDDLDRAFSSFEKTASHASSSVFFRFEVACLWASRARLPFHPSALRAYTIALSLLSRYVTTSHTIETQHSRLTAAPHSLAPNAASWAISLGQLGTAVELLEQGRAVLWSQVGRYRTPLDQLAEINPALANEFRSLSSLLEQGVVSSQSTPVGDASGYRSLSKKWDSIVDTIRALDGFSDFLKSTPFSTLQKAAANGPVVIINHDTHRSDAIIVQYTGPPILIPLPLATPDVISSLSANLAAALKLDGEGSAKTKSFRVTEVLRQLWHTVVRPVVDKIKFTCGLPVGSRIWWCPTSSLWSLPLHAAGPYKKGERNLPDIFISSYTPTLASLLQSLVPKKDASVHRAPTVLVVAQPQTPGMVSLLNVTDEVHQVKENVPSFSLLDGETATCSMVLSGLKQCPWAHFACHGLQDSHRPFNSSFALHDKHLPLLDIIQTELSTAEFAFLSACHSAAGDRTTPDEVIHLAAGLQFSGFGEW